jgi:hypothetical protein
MVFVDFRRLEAGRCTLWELGELLACLLAAWMAAGWLVDGLAGAGWLTGWPQGPQYLRQPSKWVVSGGRGGVVSNQLGTFWLSNASFKAVSWILTGSEGFTRL